MGSYDEISFAPQCTPKAKRHTQDCAVSPKLSSEESASNIQVLFFLWGGWEGFYIHEEQIRDKSSRTHKCEDFAILFQRWKCCDLLNH